MNNQKRSLYFVLSLISLSLLISGCQNAFSANNLANTATLKGSAPFHETCLALNEQIGQRVQSNGGQFNQTTFGITDDYANQDNDGNIIQDQIIISGDAGAVDNLVGFYQNELELLFAIPLYDPANLQNQDGEVRLYQLTNGASSYNFIQAFNRTAVEQMGTINDRTPIAEPNLVVHGPESPFADSTGGSGGKNTIVGSGGKNTIVGSGGDALLPLAINNKGAADAFANQWAFDQINLNQNGQRQVSQTGANVNIVVFDTSPRTEAGIQQTKWAANPFDFCNISLIDSYGDGAETKNSNDGEQLQNHGLFVSGLSQAVAPQSNIHLVQVLNDDMTGNLFTLLNGLDLYTQAQQDVTGPQKTVFNMSLVISPARDFLFGKEDEAVREAQQSYLDQLISQGCNPTSIAMCRSMGRYDKMGYVMVAAAGNANLTETQYPASDARVIGVSGSTENGHKSCFSNQGEVAAPAGNGLEDPQAQTCDLRLDQVCPDGEPCDRDGIRTIISLVDPDTGYDSGYAQWVGTSFAAPQVAGLAALSFETQTASSDFAALQTAAQGVSAAVTGNARHIVQPPVDALGSGIVDSTATVPQP